MVVSSTKKRKSNGTESNFSLSLRRIRSVRTLASFLKKTTSHLQYGWNKGFGIGQTAKVEVIRDYNAKGFVKRWKLSDLGKHIRGEITLYYAGAGNKSDEYTLVMIDIDVGKAQGQGSKAGGIKFAEVLEGIWPDLYLEPSTGGQGVHGFLLIDKRRHTARQTNVALKHLQAHLRQLAVGQDIELVEVKGSCPVVQWRDRQVGQRPQIESMTFGEPAKLPRDASRWHELRQTTVLTVGQLLDLEVPEAETRAKVRPLRATNSEASTIEYTGSNSGSPFSAELKFQLESGYLTELSRSWIGDSIQGASRVRVTAHEFGVSLAVIHHCTTDRNENGSLPTARANAIWDAAHREGLASKPWDHRKFAAVRNWLDEHGYLDVTDMGYLIGERDRTGRYHKGQAARWGASELLLEVVSPAARTRNGGPAAPADETLKRVGPDERDEARMGELSKGERGEGDYSMAQLVSKDLRQSDHPREPNPLALAYGLPTYRSPFPRQPVRRVKRA
jgi:hypothetical protein